MTAREITGLSMLIAGVVINPVGWMFSHRLLLISGGLIFLGAALFFTQRMMKRQERIDKESSGRDNSGASVPGDVHNYTGWRSGGRTDTFESNSDGNDGGD